MLCVRNLMVSNDSCFLAYTHSLFETDFLNLDPSDSWVATYLVYPPPYPPGGLLRVPPLFSAKSAQEVAARGVSCNNCLLEKHTYNHQPCYVLPRD